MKIAVFYDLPFGGAYVATQQIIAHLSQKHQIQEFVPAFSVPQNRLLSDLYALTTAHNTQKQFASKINQDFDLALITHTRFFQAPWILRYLTIPTAFLCQEPTRAFFEDFLKPKNLPLPNLIYENLIRFLKKKIEITNAQYPQAIIANSQFSSLQIKKAYGRKAIPIPLGVDLKQFYQLKLKKKHQIIVIGNDEPQKNLDFAIQTLALIDKTIRPTLVVVSPRQDSLARLQTLAHHQQVDLKTYHQITTTQLRRLYNQSLLTLAIAINEPFGLSVLESMACGTPVLALNQGGFKETVLDQKTGYLLPPDTTAFAAKITYLLKHPTKLTFLSQSSLHHARQFSWQTTAQGIGSLLFKLKFKTTGQS